MAGPLGPERFDVLNGILSATVANAASKGRKARPTDFIPTWDRDAPADWQQMLATARAMNSRLGGTDVTQGGDGDGDA